MGKSRFSKAEDAIAHLGDGKGARMQNEVRETMLESSDGATQEVKREDELIDVAAITAGLVQDRNLSDEDVDAILDAARKREKQQLLTVAELGKIMEVAKNGTRTMTFGKIPLPVRIFAIGFIIVGILSLAPALLIVLAAFNADLSDLSGRLNMSQYTVTSVVVAVIDALAFVTHATLDIIIGIRLLRGHRAKAGALLWSAVAVGIIAFVCDVMLTGTQGSVISELISVVLLIGFSIYLNPAIERGERLRRGLRDIDLEAHAEAGTLGLADKGHGFIRLDFFNVFWTFVVCCVLGDVIELAFHMIVVDPGVYQDRAGLLYGPFSPIYGVGAVLMTVALNRFKDKNVVLIFALCTVIGGAFEYFVSWFMEIGFGAVAWDYHNQWLGWLFDGRTCPLYASMFGLLGVVWIKAMLPGLLKLINRIPWNKRVVVTTICGVLMAVNCVMTLQALDNWYSRVAGKEPVTPIEQFYADTYPNDFMENRFQSMTIHPDQAARG